MKKLRNYKMLSYWCVLYLKEAEWWITWQWWKGNTLFWVICFQIEFQDQRIGLRNAIIEIIEIILCQHFKTFRAKRYDRMTFMHFFSNAHLKMCTECFYNYVQLSYRMFPYGHFVLFLSYFLNSGIPNCCRRGHQSPVVKLLG